MNIMASPGHYSVNPNFYSYYTTSNSTSALVNTTWMYPSGMTMELFHPKDNQEAEKYLKPIEDFY
jgi:hypothetical protein